MSSVPSPDVSQSDVNSKKIAAGVCALIVGYLGVHKFLLGKTSAGLLMLLPTVLSCGILGLVTWAIALAEGVIYLTRTDEEFYERYIVGDRMWF